MSEKSGREQLTRRSSFKKSLAEAALPEEYLGQLEEKRRQLDESIHKYIAAKERDYKTYEKELRHQHRTAQGQDGPNGVSRRRPSPDVTQGDDYAIKAGSVDAPSSATYSTASRGAPDGSDDIGAQLDRSTISGLRDRKASLERDKDFVGLFTPAYLLAIDGRDDRSLERVSSAPSVVPLITKSDEDGNGGSIMRANSDSLVQAKPKRPSQLALPHRTSSSGSSADGKLMSAMKTSSQQSKRKRVSLAVGDAIVAPSDNVPALPTTSTTPSHSRQRAAGSGREYTITRRDMLHSNEQSVSIEASLHAAEQATLAGLPTTENMEDTEASTMLMSNNNLLGLDQGEAKIATPATVKLDPDGDLFDLEAVEDVPINEDDSDDFENALESDEENDNPDRIEPIETAEDVLSDSDGVRYDTATGMIPEPPDSTDNAVPYLAFGPSSAVASQQPIRPGFRRPSVVDDPVFRGSNYKVAERDAVENDVYGSSFNRPASKGSFTAGSLGESYMAAHAEEMMKSRNARQQAEVES